MDHLPIKLFDAKSNSNQIINEEIINIYVCGPTVYDELHIGNLRPILFYDLVVRTYETFGFNVKYVMNITDIDDKIIQRFQETKTHNNDFLDEIEYATFFANKFLNLFEIFNLRKPNNFPRVSENIEKIQQFLQEIITNDGGYYNDDNLFFDVSSLDDYGSLSKIKIEQNKISEKNITKIKKNEEDFVLWKKTTKGIKYDSPWGKGRPGWHSECSFFIYDLFDKQTISIHGGGIDLKFPHHENERSQFKIVTKKELAKIYSYVGHVMVNNEKMSKSKGNFFYISTLLKEYDVDVIKLFILFSNYKKPLNFNDDILQEYEKLLNKMNNLKNNVLNYLSIDEIQTIDFLTIRKNKKKYFFANQFLEYLAKDFSMQNNHSILIKLIKKINKDLKEKNKNKTEILINYQEFLFICKLINIFQ